MKTNQTKRLQLLSSCLIFASTLGVFACQSSGNDTTQNTQDESKAFTVSKFDNYSMLPGSSVHATISVNKGYHISDTLSVKILNAFEDTIKVNTTSCELKANDQTCDVVVTGLKIGKSHLEFISTKQRFISDDLEVLEKPELSINNLKDNIASDVQVPITVGFPAGTNLANEKILVQFSSDNENLATISSSGSDCELSTKKLTCNINVDTVKNADGDVTITAQSANAIYKVSKKINVASATLATDKSFSVIINNTITSKIHIDHGFGLKNIIINISSKDDSIATALTKTCTLSDEEECSIELKGKSINKTNIQFSSEQILQPKTVEINVMKIQDISMGSTSACLINTTGKIYCWGSHFKGAVGDGTASTSSNEDIINDILMPTKSIPDLTFDSISSSLVFNIAITKDGDLYGWGRSSEGQLIKDNSNHFLASPTKLEFTMGPVSQISMLPDGACAISKNDSKIYCWGTNSYGSLGNGGTDVNKIYKPTKIASDLTFSEIATVGGYSTCAISKEENKLYCWGDNRYGEIGIADHKTDIYKPTEISLPDGVNKFIKVSAGEGHICAIADTGNTYCWGRNKVGQLGNGTKDNQFDSPQLVNSDIKFKEILAVGDLTCGISKDSTAVYCWGQNANNGGSLGDGITIQSNTPIKAKLPDNLKIIKIVAYNISLNNSSKICALAETGEEYCWGNNSYGLLGIGSRAPAALPTQVKFGS
jgi:alpha-tubulin suppressor-like RCC1 family protein